MSQVLLSAAKTALNNLRMGGTKDVDAALCWLIKEVEKHQWAPLEKAPVGIYVLMGCHRWGPSSVFTAQRYPGGEWVNGNGDTLQIHGDEVWQPAPQNPEGEAKS